MSTTDLPLPCQECGVEPCTATVDADGAVWFLPSRAFRASCPVLKLVRTIGAQQIVARQA